MPENEFEKEVQQKMAAFKLLPNDAIWKSVSAKIVQQNKRTRQVVLTLVLLCSFLTATLIVSDVQQKHFFNNRVVVNTFETDKNLQDISIKNNTAQSTKKNIKVLKSNTKLNETAVKEQIKNIVANTTRKQIKVQQTLSLATVHANTNQGMVTKKAQVVTGKKLINTSGETSDKITTQPFSIGENDETALPKKYLDEVSNPISTDNKLIDTNIVMANRKVAHQQIKSDTPAIVAKKTESNRKNKWAAGIIFIVGQSSTASGYLASAANSSYADYLSNGVPGSNNNVGFDQLINSPYSPTKIKPSAGFMLGIEASKKLSAKNNFVTGINYKLLTTDKAIGHDSSSNGVVRYGVGNSNLYHNHYHFIEIPLAVQIQIAIIKKHPLILEGGLSFSRLISSKALQYDINQNKYYTDNNLFHKTIIGLSAGLLINLVNNNKAPLLLGPQFYYSVTPVAGSGLYTKTHYSFVGIKLQKMLKKN
jgi:hypothetical protein